MKKVLIIGITILTICIGLTVYYEVKVNDRIDIYKITNTGLKEENINVYLNATFIAGEIVGDMQNGFYVMFSDGVQFIVYMNNKKAREINDYLLSNPNEVYRVEGVTKEIPNSIEDNGKKFVKAWLDNNHSHENTEQNHSHDITSDDFYHYFGYVYLDSTVNSYCFLKSIIYIIGIIGTLCIFSFLIKKYHIL